ncbi:O-fucosyltransferase family protein [Thermoactinomyces sp. DSM 45892]|uniref:O-fucosyltransferase family protein n=1 Tax=Thermoactinomyces sp. DSM 45892 TaxID=1882753 RepID=UPI0008950055|nr:O-fucosyltransferase family protein [Thermoactinomyces sp. DSM 45892]SDY75944.1 GDP-fucose protein O-fucosyltransferase [Thermoactinomyces sp. DSM 45892]
MLYIRYSIQGNEGLCNQLMAIFRAVGEALFHQGQGKEVCLVLSDVQTRTTVDLTKEPHFQPIKIDSFIDVDGLSEMLEEKKIQVKRIEEVHKLDAGLLLTCNRMPNRRATPEEIKDLGILFANLFPWSKEVIRLSNFVMDSMSSYPLWTAAQLRIERDLLSFSSIGESRLASIRESQFDSVIKFFSGTKNISAIYVASGSQASEYEALITRLKEINPSIVAINKKDIFGMNLELKKEFDDLCLEQQALIDWMVCTRAPLFIGPHSSSFSYLAAYIRHYQHFTNLHPDYQACWEDWFPRLASKEMA